jgi:hypothetical protein
MRFRGRPLKIQVGEVVGVTEITTNGEDFGPAAVTAQWRGRVAEKMEVGS